MKSIKFKKAQDYLGVSKVKIMNYMAPLVVSTNEGSEFVIEAELNLSEHEEEFSFEEHLNVNYLEHELSIEFEETPELRQSYFGTSRSQLKVLIPKGVELKVEADNHPVSLFNLECPVTADNENGPLNLHNCQGDKALENENGPIKLHNCGGNLTVKMDNGHLSGEALQGDVLKVESENGPIKLRDCNFPRVKIRNENGVIYYETLPVQDGDFSFENENGVVSLVVPEGFDFVLDAETENGSLKCGFEAEIEKEDGNFHIQKGEGKTRIRIKTENGAIKLNSGEHMNLNFLKMKLGQLREKLIASKTLEDKEQVMKVLESVFENLEKGLGSIDEEKIREGITGAMEKLKVLVASFDVNETRDKVVQSVDKITSELMDGLKVIIRKVKDQKEHIPHPPHIPHPSFHFISTTLKTTTPK